MASRRTPPRRVLRAETIDRRAAQAESERQLLVASATDLFSSRGYHETSVRDIATRAGFSIGALYQRFESKDALYCEVVERHYTRIWDALDRVVAQHEAFEPRLVALTGAVFSHVTTNRTFLRLYELHAPTIAEPFQTKIAQYRGLERARRALVEAFVLGHRDGRVGDADSEFLGAAYYGMLNRVIIDFLTNRRALPEPEQLVRLFLDGAARDRRSARPRRRAR
jgi:AcrR family transcriptional regulator